jgi:hypothetical protein
MMDLEWKEAWKHLPIEKTEVVVKVVMPDGDFHHDIGIYYEDTKKWNVQFWGDAARVVAWFHLP